MGKAKVADSGTKRPVGRPRSLPQTVQASFGAKLKAARKKLPQADVAKLIGLDATILSDAENNKRSLSLTHIEKIKDVCKLTQKQFEELLVLAGHKGGHTTDPIWRVYWAYEILNNDADFRPSAKGPSLDQILNLPPYPYGHPATMAFLTILWGRKTGRRLYSSSEHEHIVAWLGCDSQGFNARLPKTRLGRDVEGIVRRHFANQPDAADHFRQCVAKFVGLKPIKPEVTTIMHHKPVPSALPGDEFIWEGGDVAVEEEDLIWDEDSVSFETPDLDHELEEAHCGKEAAPQVEA